MENRAPLVRVIALTVVVGVLPGWLVVPQLAIAGGKPTPARRLRAPEHITPEAKAELVARMGRHAETMSNLLRAVVLLDRPTIRVLAGRIADEEIIARSRKSVHEAPPLSLPREFFLQQAKLAVAARDLAAAAAEEGDDRILADRFAIVTGTCVACHSAYLHGRPDSEPSDTKAR